MRPSDEEGFRDEVRATIQVRLPSIYTDPEARQRRRTIRIWREDYFSDDPARRASAIEWRDALAELGWTAPGWPREKGGAGLSVVQRRILSEELAAADAPGLGTRHRAAIEISELTDAVVIVVSEETGKVSVVHGGVIERGLDEEALLLSLEKLMNVRFETQTEMKEE